jgi:hypothetical protein
MSQKIAKAMRLLQAAIALLEENPRKRRPEWFEGTGHLSRAGIAHLHSLFETGKSSYAAAKEMGLSYRSVAIRRKRHQPKEIVIL